MPDQRLLTVAHVGDSRVVLGKNKFKDGERTADSALYVPHTRLLPVELLLRQKRLLYLSRIRFKAPQVLSALIQAEAEMPESWAAMVTSRAASRPGTAACV